MYVGNIDLNVPLFWTVEDVLSAGECRQLIARIDAIGATPAPITTAQGFVMRPDVRNNSRVVHKRA